MSSDVRLLPALPDIVRNHAACKGHGDVFFGPADEQEEQAAREARKAKAKTICATCPVVDECTDYAVEFRPSSGIWGGFTTSERRVNRDVLRAAAIRRSKDLERATRRHPANPKPKPAPTERVIGIPHSRNSFLGDRIA